MKRVPDVSQAVARNWGSTPAWASSSYSPSRLPQAARDQAAKSVQGARTVAAATREPWLVDAANHTFLQARYTSSIWATLLSLIGVAFVLRCFRSDR